MSIIKKASGTRGEKAGRTLEKEKTMDAEEAVAFEEGNEPKPKYPIEKIPGINDPMTPEMEEDRERIMYEFNEEGPFPCTD